MANGRNESELLSLGECLFEALKALADAVYALGGTDEMVLRAFLDPVRAAAMAAIIVHGVPELSAVASVSVPVRGPLASELHRVYMHSYVLPSFQELERLWGKGNVSAVFDGREWTRDPACEGVDETPGEREMWLYKLPKDEDRDVIIAEKAAQGFYPALPVEAVAFAAANPKLQREFSIAVLGAWAMRGDSEYMPGLILSGGRRVLSSLDRDERFHASSDLLFVRRISSPQP